jgi:hypothetical protein
MDAQSAPGAAVAPSTTEPPSAGGTREMMGDSSCCPLFSQHFYHPRGTSGKNRHTAQLRDSPRAWR